MHVPLWPHRSAEHLSETCTGRCSSQSRRGGPQERLSQVAKHLLLHSFGALPRPTVTTHPVHKVIDL